LKLFHVLEYIVIVVDQVLLLRLGNLLGSIFGTTSNPWQSLFVVYDSRLEIARSEKLELYLELVLELLAIRRAAQALSLSAVRIMAFGLVLLLLFPMALKLTLSRTAS
jgi:hypothetical protein